MALRNFRELEEKVLARPGAAERIAREREAALEEIALYDLRRTLGVSQAELAARLHQSQPSISKLESQGDLKLSTLRDYLAGLGGTLEVCARFEDEVVVLDIEAARPTR